ncbi:putative ABC transporter, partial [Aureobasidium melanogenum]
MSSDSLVVQVLHWITPVAIGIAFSVARLIAFCTLQKPSKCSRGSAKARQTVSLVLSAAVLLLFIVQALAYALHQFQELDQQDVTQDVQVYIGGSIFIWGTVTINLLGKPKRVWHPYLTTWILAALLESCILLVKNISRPSKLDLDFDAPLQVGRIVCLLGLVGSVVYFSLHRKLKQHRADEECRPLLDGHGRMTDDYTSVESEDEDGDLPNVEDEDDGPNQTKELKEKQRKRLQECGSWMAYLRDFKVLAKLAWPSGDRSAKICLAILIVVILADRALNLLVPRQLGIITDKLSTIRDTGEIPIKEIGLWMLYVWLSSYAGLHAITQFCQLPIEQHAYRKIGTTAFGHIMNLSMDFHSNKHSGELMAAIGQGQHLYRLCDFVFLDVGPMVFDLIIALVYVTLLFDASITLIMILVGVGYTCIGSRSTSWAMNRRRRYNQAQRNEAKVQNESIGNWQTVAHFNMADYECAQYANAVDEHNIARGRYYMVHYAGYAAQNLLLLLGQLSAALLAAYRVSRGAAPVGNFITLVTYWHTIEAPLTSVSFSVRQLSQMLIDSERLLELLRTKPSVTDRPGAKPLRFTKGKIEFDNVRFSYDIRKASLDDVSFVAEAGKTIALVGETGGGKSTILKLLFRYYDVSSGSIRIDGQDIRSVTLNSLRTAFGMVPQDPCLFNTSIMENVRYARLEATDEEVKEACRAAAVHDRIISFPDGYQSTVGERGVKLSGGELQRIAIARAILRNPHIVLLDEATSMVDAETEAAIQRAFKRLTKGRTTFVVAHRLSTIQDADLILVVQNGQIVERGTHEQLYGLNGKYTRLWSKQLSKQTTKA